MGYFIIDQAGKMEATNHDTILSFYSNNIQYSIKISKEIKQEMYNQCKKRYNRNLTIRMFAYGLYLLLDKRIKCDSIIQIDDEYNNHDSDIKLHLSRHLNIQKERIQFVSIGKCTLAHKIANSTFSGKLKPNEVITSSNFNLLKILPERKLKEYLK